MKLSDMRLGADSSVSPPARILLNAMLVTMSMHTEPQGLYTIFCDVHRTWFNDNS